MPTYDVQIATMEDGVLRSPMRVAATTPQEARDIAIDRGFLTSTVTAVSSGGESRSRRSLILFAACSLVVVVLLAVGLNAYREPKQAVAAQAAATPLDLMVAAIERADVAQVKALLKQGVVADASVTGRPHWSLLMNAAAQGHRAIPVLKELILAGANVNYRDDDGWTALMLAAGSETADAANLLLNAGADVNSSSVEGWTPLICAAVNPHAKPAVASAFLVAGADIDAEDVNGERAIDHAREARNQDVVEFLASFKPKHIVSFSVFVRACMAGPPDKIKELLAAGAKINEEDEDGTTALGYAALKCSDPNIITTLINAGALVNPRSADVVTPLMMAVRNPHPDIAATLIRRGARVNTKFFDATALDLARAEHNSPVVTLLILAGATGK